MAERSTRARSAAHSAPRPLGADTGWPWRAFTRGRSDKARASRAAAMPGRRDPWVLPVEAGARRAAQAAKAALAAGAGGGSDHLALVRAFNGWAAARAGGGPGGERAYAAAHSVSGGTLAMLDGMRGQLLGELTARPLRPRMCLNLNPIPAGQHAGKALRGTRRVKQAGRSRRARAVAGARQQPGMPWPRRPARRAAQAASAPRAGARLHRLAGGRVAECGRRRARAQRARRGLLPAGPRPKPLAG